MRGRRFFGVIGLLGLLSFESQAQDDCHEKFSASVYVPVQFSCEVIETGLSFIRIRVVTNTRTRIQVECEGFKRRERNCEGQELDTVDCLVAHCDASFEELILCDPENGARLETRRLSETEWCANPHNGGYEVFIEMRPAPEIDPCDDAGCYQSECEVWITAEPFEKECDIFE